MTNNSTKPSGATTFFQETSFGILSHSQILKLEIEGTKKGLEFIYKLIDSKKLTEISPELVLELHENAFGWIFPKWAGQFRNIQVTYSGKEAVSYFLVSEFMKNLCDDLQMRLKNLPKTEELTFIDEIVKLLAWFQHRFVFIHPFQDYNGRTARMLTSLILLKLKLPAIEIQVESEEDRKKYLHAMQLADDGNIELLEKLIEKALVESLNTY